MFPAAVSRRMCFPRVPRNDHPNRLNAITLCFFSSLKTLLTLTQGIPRHDQRPESAFPLPGFQVITYGRFCAFHRGNLTVGGLFNRHFHPRPFDLRL
jgi:hypothetical protein